MKRIIAVGDNDMTRVANPDGSVTYICKATGITQTWLGHQLIEHHLEPEVCRHQSAYQTYSGPDGNIYHCPACGSTVDEDFEIINSSSEIPF